MTVAMEATEITLSVLMESIERGDEVRLLKNGRAVATIVPDRVDCTTPKRTDKEIGEAQAAFEHIRAQAKGLKLGAFDWEDYKVDRDFGRR